MPELTEKLEKLFQEIKTFPPAEQDKIALEIHGLIQKIKSRKKRSVDECISVLDTMATDQEPDNSDNGIKNIRKYTTEGEKLGHDERNQDKDEDHDVQTELNRIILENIGSSLEELEKQTEEELKK